LGNIGTWYNAYSGWDAVQVSGGNTVSVDGQEAGFAGRTFAGANNIEVATPLGDIGIQAHSDLHGLAVAQQLQGVIQNDRNIINNAVNGGATDIMSVNQPSTSLSAGISSGNQGAAGWNGGTSNPHPPK
jgi:hypothetical protein